MLNRWFNTEDPEKEEKLKSEWIEISKVNKEYVNYIKVTIQENEYVHVVVIDDYTIPNKPNLVLLHGSTGTSFCYFTMFNELSKYFTVYSVDLPGQGLSSRNNYDYLNRETAEDYFLSRLKTTFMSLKLNKIILCSHSFSGYIAGLFFIKYPEWIDRWVFLSPIGLCSTFKEFISGAALDNMVQSLAFKLKRGPHVGIKLFGLFSQSIFKTYCERNKFRALTDEEYETFTDFLFCQVCKDYSSDNAVYSMFDKNLKNYKPLSLYIESFKKTKKIWIAYGDEDWCPIANGEEFRNLLGEEQVEIIKIPKANHMMQTDNPGDLNKMWLEFFKRENVI